MNEYNDTAGAMPKERKRGVRTKKKKLRCKNGITVQADIGFALDSEPSKLFPIVQYLLTVMASLSVIFMFKSYMNASGKYDIAGLDTVFLTSLLTAAACLIVHRGKPFFKLAGLAFMLLNTFYVLRNILKEESPITNAVVYTRDVYLSLIPQPEFENYIVMRTPGIEEDLTVLFIAAAFMMTMLIAISCIYYTNFPILFLCTFPVFVLGVFWEWKPSSVTVVIMIACWFTSLSLNLINHASSKKSSGNNFAVSARRRSFYLISSDIKQRFFMPHAAVAFLTAAAVFATVFGVLSPYSEKIEKERPQKLNELRKDITRKFNKAAEDVQEGRVPFLRSIPGRGRQVGGTNGGQLGVYDSIHFNGTEMLNIGTYPFSRPIYLRGYAAEEYISNRWDPVEPDDQAADFYSSKKKQVLDYTWLRSEHFRSTDKRDINILNVNADERLVYAPYGTEYSANKAIAPQEYDGIASPEDDKDRAFNLNQRYTDEISWDDLIDTAVSASYLEYGDSGYEIYSRSILKNEVYRELPSAETQELLESIISEAGSDEEGLSLSKRIKLLRRWFTENGFTYDRAPGKTPDSEDFVTYFLTEQKQGYCTYYASAAVMLMRTMGYPARYVEGYIIEPDQQNLETGRVSVPDNSAHAWCEVFIKNCGWFPVEMTPGYDGLDNPNLTDDQKYTPPESADTDSSEGASDSSQAESSSKDDSKSTDESTDDTSNTDSTAGGETSETGSEVGSEIGSEPTAVGEEDPSAEADAVVGIDPDDGSGDGNGSGGIFAGLTKEQMGYILLVLLFIAGFAAAVVVRRRKILGDIEDGVNSSDGTKSVIFCYTSLLKYISLLGIENDRQLTDVQLSAQIRTKLAEQPDLNDIFVHISESAITAYMSGSAADKTAADSSRRLFDKARGLIYEKLGFTERLAAKWVYGLY